MILVGSWKVELGFRVLAPTSIYFLSLLVLRVGADPPPLPLRKQEGMGDGLLAESLQKQHCLPPGSPCMHVFFTRQGDIMKLGLEKSSLS